MPATVQGCFLFWDCAQHHNITTELDRLLFLKISKAIIDPSISIIPPESNHEFLRDAHVGIQHGR